MLIQSLVFAMNFSLLTIININKHRISTLKIHWMRFVTPDVTQDSIVPYWTRFVTLGVT